MDSSLLKKRRKARVFFQSPFFGKRKAGQYLLTHVMIPIACINTITALKTGQDVCRFIRRWDGIEFVVENVTGDADKIRFCGVDFFRQILNLPDGRIVPEVEIGNKNQPEARKAAAFFDADRIFTDIKAPGMENSEGTDSEDAENR